MGNEQLLKNVKVLKNRSGLTTEKFAELIRVNTHTVRAWFDGACLPQNDHLIKLSLYLKVNIDDLVRSDISFWTPETLTKRYHAMTKKLLTNKTNSQ